MGCREAGDEPGAERSGIGRDGDGGSSQRARCQRRGEASDFACGGLTGAGGPEQLRAGAADTYLAAGALEQDQAEFVLKTTDPLGDGACADPETIRGTPEM